MKQESSEGTGKYNRSQQKMFRGRAFPGGDMDSWKKAVLAGAIGAAAVLFLKKKNAAGVLAGGVALAVLAAEYPEKFEQVRESLPGYFDRSMQVMEMAARAGKRITEAAGQSAIRSEEHTSELQSPCNLVCRLLLE